MTRKFSFPPLFQWLTLLLGFTLFTGNLVVAQDNTTPPSKSVPRLGLTLVKGKVSNADGPLAGVTVTQKGTSTGATSDADGNFEIGVSGTNPQLEFSYVGYDAVDIPVKGKTTINATLTNRNGSLNSVVVTALGITRNTRSLGYDVGQIKGNDMDRVAQTNAINGMAALVSGVTVSSTGASPTSTVSVVIRGIRSLTGDNQPLFVIDGVPVKNSLNNVGQNTGNNNTVDYGNAISDLNPTDIENISILKGPSAAALYGSRAGNGVVLVTTKSGKKAKGLGMTFTTIDQANVPYHYFPNNLSYTVGSDPYTEPNANNSLNGVLVDLAGTDTYRFGTPLNKGLKAIQWNSPKDANGNYIAEDMVSHNNMENFMQTGFTSINTISIENSTDKDQYHFSYTNTADKGIVPTTGLSRNNLSLNITHKISNGFKLSTVINYTRSGSDNVIGGNDGVLKDIAYLSPSVDIRQMKDYWLVPGIAQRKARPPVGVDGTGGDPDDLVDYNDVDNNPWFSVNTTKNSFIRNHLFGNVMASFTFSPHWSAFVRYSQDLLYDNRESKMSKSNVNALNGFYGVTNAMNTESNTDFLATYHDNIGKDFDLSASVGGNIMYSYSSGSQIYSGAGGLTAPELFNVSNISRNNVNWNSGYYEKNVNSLYATASLGFRDLAYLDLTGRNDWSSTLPANENSYFYPSASLSLLLNKIFNMGHDINMLKLRGGWASVGKDTDPYNLYPIVSIGSYGNTSTETVANTLKNPTLKPEQAISTEIGVDLAMYNNRLRFNGTVYRSDNKNQILPVSMPASTGYASRFINAGELRSQGLELSLGGTIIQSRDWTWDMTVNYTKNNSYVMSLADGVDYFSFWQADRSGSWTYAKGKPIPNMVDANGKQVISDGKIGQLWDDQMKTVTDKSSPYFGYPLLDDGGGLQSTNDFQHKIVAGNFNPDLLLGVQTTITWKFLTLYANIDMRFGGLFYSETYRYMGSDAALKRQENVGIPIPDKYKNDIPAYLKSNPDAFIKVTGLQQYHLVGGPTTETGGFPYSTDGVTTINDGAFYPGVVDNHDGTYSENLGDPNITHYDNYEDAVTNGPWLFGRMDMFDASYIKLRELTLTTQAPQKWVTALHVQGITFGLYMRNLILWTKAKSGVDPELAYQMDGGASSGGASNGQQFRQGVERYNITPWTLQPGLKLSVRF